ncbi:MAG: hypothetical protein JL50_11310 [Peptococcaceae bacterium BICA1-7]|nr:MAG: hypothetical protein JL50_11310 [Peptococcaceae bacterium BICA1-7]
MLTEQIKKKLFSENHFSQMLKHSGIYLLGAIAGAGLGIIYIPILTRLLSEKDYGIYSLYNASVPILSVLLTLNLHASISRYCLEEKEDIQEFVGTSVLLIIGSLLLLSPLYLYYSDFLSLWTGIDKSVLWLAYMAMIGTAVASIYGQILIGFRYSQRYSLYNFFVKFIIFIVGTSGVIWLEKTYFGLLLGQSVAWFIILIYTAVRIKSLAKIAFNKEHVFYILNYSVPLIPYVLSGVLLNYFGRFMVNSLVGTEATAHFSVGYDIGSVFLIIVSSIQSSSLVDQVKLLNMKKYKLFESLMLKTLAVQVFLAMLLIFFAKEVLCILADDKYYDSVNVIYPVIWSNIFLSCLYIHLSGIFFYKKTVWFSINAVLSSLFCIMLNYILIPLMGFVGAGYSMALSFLVYYIVTWLVARYILKFKTISNLKIVILLIPAIIATYVAKMYDSTTIFEGGYWLVIMLKLCIIIVSGLGLLKIVSMVTKTTAEEETN